MTSDYDPGHVEQFRLRLDCLHIDRPNAKLGTLKAFAVEHSPDWELVSASGPHLKMGPADAWPWRFLEILCPVCGARGRLSRRNVARLLSEYWPKGPGSGNREAVAALPFGVGVKAGARRR